MALAASVIVTVIFFGQNPEKLILSTWRELSWEYEMVNKVDTSSTNYKKISNEVKSLIGQKLVIHRSETWQFLPNGKLKLKGSGGAKIVDWKLNGRGHILELKYKDTKENYNISELTDSTLVINFETDIEARGIAKLSFASTKKYYDIKIQ